MTGEYLFSDEDFVRHLSVTNRNVFQKIFDEIKYLCKVATAGSKEFRELEKVKRTFEKIYREGGKAQSDTKYRLENGSKRKYNKRSRYSETETLFLGWENGSAPVGEVKRFVRFGKVHYYQKTENGCVELSRQQFNERNGENAENTYRRAEREISEAHDYDESTQRGLLGDYNSHRDTGRNATVFGQAIREELSDDTRRSESGALGYNSGNDISQAEYNDEASDESGASFTFSNDYATIRNFMKEGDTAGEADVGPVSYSLSDSDGKQFAPRTRFDVFGKELMKVEEIAPVREAETAEAMFPDDFAPFSDDPERFDSLTDEDAPPVRNVEYGEHGNQMSMPKSTVNMIAQNVKASLWVEDNQMGEVRSLIDSFAMAEFPSREQLFRELKDKFGTHREKITDDATQEVKNVLRRYRLNVSDAIKGDIADYGNLRKRNFGNANSLGVEICDDVRNGTIYPSAKTIENALELAEYLMDKYNVPKSNVIRHYDVTGKLCPAYWVDDAKWKSEFWNKLKGSTSGDKPKEQTTTTKTETPSTSNSGVLYRVQTGAFSLKKNASDKCHAVKVAGFDAFLVQVGALWKVQVGAFTEKKNAEAMVKKLQTAGFTAIVVKATGNPGAETLSHGSTVRVKRGAKTYEGTALATFVYSRDHVVHSIAGDRVVITYNDIVVAAVHRDDLIIV